MVESHIGKIGACHVYLRRHIMPYQIMLITYRRSCDTGYGK